MSPQLSSCRECMTPLPLDAVRGICPHCLLLVGLGPVDSMAESRENSERSSNAIDLGDAAGSPQLELAGYDLFGEIGRGGMGIIYRARQRSLGRMVALKVIRSGTEASPAAVARFRKEAAAAARLRHPGIVAIHEIGECDGRQYYSMDLIPGRSLAEVLRSGPMPPRTAADCVRTVADAVQSAHDAGVLHRDLKPSNILMDDSGEPHVADFGLAKLVAGSDVAGDETESHTLTGTILGTPNYMPPEQVHGSTTEATVRSDVYSLGAILYECLTGRPPFAAATPFETMNLVVDQDPTPPRRLNRALPRDLETICLKCLSKTPSARYGAASEVARDLGRFLANEPIQARPAGTVERVWRWSMRKPAMAALYFVIIVAAVSFSTMTVYHNLRLQKERETVRQQAELARQNIYAADISVAFRAVSDGNLGLAVQLLDGLRPKPGETDLRGFEWRYLRAQCQGDPCDIRDPGIGPIKAMDVSEDGSRIAIVGTSTAGLYDWPTGKWHLRVEDLPQASSDGRWTVEMADELSSRITHATPYFPGQVGDGLKFLNPDEAQRRYWTNPFRMDGAQFASLSSDGKWFAIGGGYRHPKVWDLELGKITFVLPGWSANPVFIPGTSQIAVASGSHNSDEGCVKFYDLASRRELHCWTNLGGALAISADGKVAATGGNRQPIRTWRLPSFQHLQTYEDDLGSDRVLALDLPGRWLASAIPDRTTVRIWNLAAGKHHADLQGNQAFVRSVTFDPAGSYIASGGADQCIRLWDFSNRTLVKSFHGHRDDVVAVRFAKNKRELFSASWDGTIRRWPIGDRPLTTPFGGYSFLFERVARISITPRGEVAMTCTNRDIVLIRPDSESVPRTFKTDEPGDRVVLLGGGNVYCLAPEVQPRRSRLHIWPQDRPDSHHVVELEPESVTSNDFVLSNDGRNLATSTFNGTLLVWETQTGRIRHRLRPDEISSAGGFDFSPSGRLLASTDAFLPRTDIFDLSTGRILTNLSTPASLSIRFSPDGRVLAIADRYRADIQLWNTANWTHSATLSGHREPVNSFSFSPDGRTLASTAGKRSLKLWNLIRCREIGTLVDNAFVDAPAFSPDGTFLVAYGVGLLWYAPALADLYPP